MIEAHPYLSMMIAALFGVFIAVVAIGIASMAKDADNQDGVEE